MSNALTADKQFCIKNLHKVRLHCQKYDFHIAFLVHEGHDILALTFEVSVFLVM